MALIGRTDELRVLESAIGAARSGLSAAVVVHGPAGVGKTTVLLEAARTASDFRVVQLTAPETDIELAYGGLVRLLAPFASDVYALSGPTGDVLRGALGLGARAHGDRHMVGLAALALFSEAARRQPILCVVDDAQWLDSESRDALVLIARRLGADRVAVMIGLRDPVDSERWPSDLPRLGLSGLPEHQAVELATLLTDGAPDADRARRIAAASEGRPLAIVQMAAEHGRGTEPEAAGELPISLRIEDHFARRVRALSPGARDLLLIAALDISGDPEVVKSAAGELGIPADAVESLRVSGLLDPGEVRPQHPLVRSAIRDSASEDDRRRVHRALASASGDPRYVEQRAWHRSGAAATTDDDVATELVEVADTAQRRGAHAAAGALLARSAELTPDRSRRTARVLAAAASYTAGGATVRARELLVRSAPLFDDDLDRARALRLHAMLRFDAGEVKGTVPMFVDAARMMYPIDRAEARATLMLAFAAARPNGRFALPGEGAISVCAAARSMPADPSAEPSFIDLLLDGVAALFLDGHRVCVPILAAALERLQQAGVSGPDGLVWLAMGCWAAGSIGDDEMLHAVSQRFIRSASDDGIVVGLAHGQLYAAMSELLSGSIETARAYFDERSELMRALGSGIDVGDMVSMAWSGREPETRAAARAVSTHATERGLGWMLFFVEYSLCVLELGLGNYRSAFETALKHYDESPFVALTSFPDLIEAAVRCGERPAAERALDELDARALPNRTPLALGLLARCRGLLADDETADGCYLEALEHLRRSRSEIQVARTQLLYGEWLRRRKRRSDARSQLAEAHTAFTRIGAEAFAERARRELVATGERARARSASSSELTPQERAIAELAPTATNAEIAIKLFLSPATVDYHLRKVYRKLGITSRRQLGTRLGPHQEPGD